MAMFFFVTLCLVLVGSYLPPDCVYPEECTMERNPPCTVVCIDKYRDIASWHLFWALNGWRPIAPLKKYPNVIKESLDFSEVTTVYLKGGEHFHDEVYYNMWGDSVWLGPGGEDYTGIGPGTSAPGTGLKGYEGYPVRIMAYPETHAVIGDAKFVSDRPVSHFQFGELETGSTLKFHECSFNLNYHERTEQSDVVGFQDIRFLQVKFDGISEFRINVPKSGGAQEFAIGGSILFERCFFFRQEDPIDFRIQGFYADGIHTSTITFRDNQLHPWDNGMNFQFLEMAGTVLTFEKNDMSESTPNAITYTGVTVDTEKKFIPLWMKFENNQVKFESFQIDLRGESFSLYFINNHLRLGKAANNIDIINIDTDMTANALVIANNIVRYEKNKFIDWDTTKPVECRECVFTRNYFEGHFDRDVPAVYEELIDNSFANGDSHEFAMDSIQLLDRKERGYVSDYSCGNFDETLYSKTKWRDPLSLWERQIFICFPHAAFDGTDFWNLEGDPTWTPVYDWEGRIRHHTGCPDRMGCLASCPCNPAYTGLKCEIPVTSYDRDVRKVFTRPLVGDFTSNINRREDEYYTSSPHLTIRDACSTEYWGIILDTDNELWMWGENYENDYIKNAVGDDVMYTSELVKIDRSNEFYTKVWKPVGLAREGIVLTDKDQKWKWELSTGTKGSSIPKKIACTESSIFVLTGAGDVYVMGQNEDHEIDGDRELTSFHLTKQYVVDIETSPNTAYFMLGSNYDPNPAAAFRWKLRVPYCENPVGSNCVIDHTDGMPNWLSVATIFAIGRNDHGVFASDYLLEHSGGKYVMIHYDFVAKGMKYPQQVADDDIAAQIMYESKGVTNYGHYRKPKPDWFVEPRSNATIFPRMDAFQYGFMLTYNLLNRETKMYENYYFYAGMDHPSTTQKNTTKLERIDFAKAPASAMSSSYDGIDFIDRIIDTTPGNGGCLYIVSQNKLHVSGNKDCSLNNGLKSNPYHETPQIVPDGDYQDEKIYDLRCGHSCYMVTERGLYTWGRTNDGIGFDADCDDEMCRTVTLASTEYSNAIPGLGNSVPRAVYDWSLPDEEKFLNEKYDVMGFTRPSKLNVFEVDAVYKFPPKIVMSESGMSGDRLTILISKPHVFGEADAEMNWMEFDDIEKKWKVRDTVTGECLYPFVSDTTKHEWIMWREHDDELGAIDYYYLNMPWEQFRSNCSFEWSPRLRDDFDIYVNRLVMTTPLYRGFHRGTPMFQREHFIFDLEVRFPKEILMSEITVQQDEFDGWFDAYIVDKSFDRATRVGTVNIVTVARRPNFFVFPDIAAEYADVDGFNHFPDGDPHVYSTTKRVGTVVPNSPEYFEEDDFYMTEDDLPETTPEMVSSNRRSYYCDDKNCYQRWTLSFKIIKDYRVCAVPKTVIPLNWVQFCNIDDVTFQYYPNSGVLDEDKMGDLNYPHIYDYDCVKPSREFSFKLQLSVDNLCGGLFVENIDTDFFLGVYEDWTYQIEIDTATHVFSIEDWIYFKAEITSEKVTINHVLVHRVVVVDTSTDVTLFEPDSQNSDVSVPTSGPGVNCQFTVDNLRVPSAVGFHFKMNNDPFKLQPGVQKKFSVDVYLRIDYEGNEVDVIPEYHPPSKRRTEVDSGSAAIGMATAMKTLDIHVINDKGQQISVWPYIVLVAVMMILAAVAGIVMSCIICIMRRKQVNSEKDVEDENPKGEVVEKEIDADDNPEEEVAQKEDEVAEKEIESSEHRESTVQLAKKENE